MLITNNENGVKRAVKKLLNRHKWFWWMPAANGFGQQGVADFCALRAGVFLALETKFGSNKPTVLQVAYLNSVRAEGGFSFVVTEKTLDWLEIWMVAFDRAIEATKRNEKPDDRDGAAMLDAINAMTALL